MHTSDLLECIVLKKALQEELQEEIPKSFLKCVQKISKGLKLTKTCKHNWFFLYVKLKKNDKGYTQKNRENSLWTSKFPWQK